MENYSRFTIKGVRKIAYEYRRFCLRQNIVRDITPKLLKVCLDVKLKPQLHQQEKSSLKKTATISDVSKWKKGYRKPNILCKTIK